MSSGSSFLALVSLSVLAACGSSGGGSGGGGVTTHPELLHLEYGQLADVYCLRDGVQVLYDPDGAETRNPPGRAKGRDVLVGTNIRDQRPANSTLSDAEITYDFIGSDPDTLQPKLFIPREETSEAFRAAFDALDDQLREVAPMLFGQGGPGLPYGVVPRNAAVRLTFSAPLGVDDSFFVERNSVGTVTGLRNTEAVQLLKIVGDPTQQGGFVPLPVRVVVQGTTLVLDPVLLGTEGLQYQTTNNAAGLPASPDQLGANIRVAVALEGPLAIPGLRESPQQGLTGLNNSARLSVVRDFRSGNANDTSDDFARGFVRDPLPLRIVGDIVMYLHKVEQINPVMQEVTVFKNGLSHEIDRGDTMRFQIPTSNPEVPQVVSTTVVIDPEDDRHQPTVQHVRVRIRSVAGLEGIDPSNLPSYPPTSMPLEQWLVENAPKFVLVAEFTAGAGPLTGDDPRNFLRFTPEPLNNLDGSAPAANEFVSPFAGSVVRFTKPVDMETVKTADTFFFAMRDLTSQASKDLFIANRPNAAGGIGMNPAAFDEAKYRTPYLVTARLFDENGSQTELRLQPLKGFYLDDTMRNPPAGADYRYFLHLISNSTDGGIRDLAGNAVDLQGTTAESSNSVVIPFTVDTRIDSNSVPFFPDNIAISVVRRFASRDEDAQPSYFLSNEVLAPSQSSWAAAYPLEDLFGAFVYLDNKLVARSTTRVRQVADNLNQTPYVANTQQGTPPAALAWCPQFVGGEGQIGSNSSTSLLNAGLQNPLNPYGCRLQTLWREIDLSLSRTNPFDFNLDIEQMYWAPYTQTNLSYDEFDRVSLWLGHSEFRPTPCVGDFSALASMPSSGLINTFEKNFAYNPRPTGGDLIETQSPRGVAYVDKPLTIDPSTVVYEQNHVNRFLPLPTFQKPYFVFRDELVREQALNCGVSGDMTAGFMPYILSPFPNGQGRRWIDVAPNVQFVNSFWNDGTANPLGGGSDAYTGGLVGSIALPLLADFWTYCDVSTLPVGGGYIALGTNGWQVAITVQSGSTPNFRVLSAGRAAVPPAPPTSAVCRSPGDSQWQQASGGFIGGSTSTTPPGDNTFYWIMLDVLKRQSVITNGFLDLNNPHRVPEGFADPRLGPFYLAGGQSTTPAGVLPRFDFEFDPPLAQLPPGTSVIPQFRGASVVDPTPWYWNAWIQPTAGTPLFPTPTPTSLAYTSAHRTQLKPDAVNFPLDPYKAGDAHIRKWDARSNPPAGARNWWTYFYNRTVTTYVEDPNDLMLPTFTIQFQGPNESFTPRHIRYMNWRFVTSNNVDANPPVTPSIESFSLSYRFQ